MNHRKIDLLFSMFAFSFARLDSPAHDTPLEQPFKPWTKDMEFLLHVTAPSNILIGFITSARKWIFLHTSSLLKAICFRFGSCIATSSACALDAVVDFIFSSSFAFRNPCDETEQTCLASAAKGVLCLLLVYNSHSHQTSGGFCSTSSSLKTSSQVAQTFSFVEL
ncbi:hypothetical protein EV356DRAFT_216232 [Viridothelium virens]|uniref:Uncharacterized protein n=1 Tax=Viridothelium virens TaxID=1048519 RepID=A0A6A6H5Q4_VIRVR|nr:hypothetical protein EV356DRAFT_216232 [Viridothelium virens]